MKNEERFAGLSGLAGAAGETRVAAPIEFITVVEHDLPLPRSAAPAPNGQTQSRIVVDSRG
jgi:hypothetical protein